MIIGYKWGSCGTMVGKSGYLKREFVEPIGENGEPSGESPGLSLETKGTSTILIVGN